MNNLHLRVSKKLDRFRSENIFTLEIWNRRSRAHFSERCGFDGAEWGIFFPLFSSVSVPATTSALAAATRQHADCLRGKHRFWSTQHHLGLNSTNRFTTLAFNPNEPKRDPQILINEIAPY